MFKLIPVLLILVGSFVGSLGTALLKKQTNYSSFLQLWKTSTLWIGFYLYGISTILYLVALRQEELSVLYPLISLNYVWTMFFSVKYLKEKMSKGKWLALLGIIIGIVLIGLGS